MAIFNVTIDHTKVAANLTGFPVYIDLANMPSGFWSTVSNGGGDIRCYASDGATSLAREVVSCDTATSKGELHVKADISSSVDTVIIIEVDGSSTEPSSSSTYGSQSVWSNGYVAVYHMKDGITLSASDSTGTNNGTLVNTPTATTGKVDGAGNFSYSSYQHINVPANASLDITNTLTVMAWVKPTSFPNTYNTIVHRGDARFYEYFFKPDGKLAVYLNTASSRSYDGTGTYAVSAGTWAQVGFTYDSSAGLIGYVNANVDATLGAGGAISNTSGTPLSIARDSFTPGRFYDGAIDEVRVSNVVRSGSWINTEYNNQNSPTSFYSISSPAGVKTLSTDLIEITFVDGTVYAVDQTSVAKIIAIFDSNQVSVARITRVMANSQPSAGRLQKIFTQSIETLSRIVKSITSAQYAVARLVKELDSSQTSQARIQWVLGLVQESVSRVSKILDIQQSAKARLVKELSKTQTGIAAIQYIIGLEQHSRARISKLLSLTTTAKAQIAKEFNKTIVGRAWLAFVASIEQPSLSTIQKVLELNQSSQSYIGTAYGQVVAGKDDTYTVGQAPVTDLYREIVIDNNNTYEVVEHDGI